MSDIINTVIFDLDGTLLYTLDDLTDSTNFAINSFNYDSKTVDQIKSYVGNGVGLLIERALPEGINNPHYKECIELFKKHYAQNMYNKTKPYDGIPELLSSLKQNGFNIAVISNKFDLAVKELCNHYFKDQIDIAIGQIDGKYIKPNPDGVMKIAELLNTTLDKCIMIGDSEVDIQTADNANIPCISVTWGYKDIDFLYRNGATTLVYSPQEILELI